MQCCHPTAKNEPRQVPFPSLTTLQLKQGGLIPYPTLTAMPLKRMYIAHYFLMLIMNAVVLSAMVYLNEIPTESMKKCNNYERWHFPDILIAISCAPYLPWDGATAYFTGSHWVGNLGIYSLRWQLPVGNQESIYPKHNGKEKASPIWLEIK